ncbi:MAG: ATP-binding protein [Candidatus Micrarchaeota archaeon]|nr:ATP-binding protein [Candidatus Micrarchaeota archaeon]
MEYYPRKVEQKLEKWLKRREVIVIKGPRQAGKTTLLLHLKERLGGNYITLEDPDFLEEFDKRPKQFAKRFSGNLFLDEVQYSEHAGKRIKFIYDTFPEIKLFVSGSGSFDVKVPVAKYLVGRAILFELYPLVFQEFVLWKAKDLYKIYIENKKEVENFISGKKASPETAFENEFRLLLEEYLIYGGFPAIVKEDDPEIKVELLKALQQTYLEKDVFFFFDIRHLGKFRDVLKFLSFNTCKLLEPFTLSSSISIDIRTLRNYLSVLENTYIISLIRPFFRNVSTELRKRRKICFVDTGLRNAVLSNFASLSSRTDKGQLLENYVFIQLRDYGEIRYWRTKGKAEVDFVLIKDGEIIPVEVKSFGKIKRGFLSFLKTYKPKRAIVFSEKDFGIKKIEKTKVLFVPHWMI